MRSLLEQLIGASLVTLALFAGLLGVATWFVACMPGRSYSGPRDTDAENAALTAALRAHVVLLAEAIGERNFDNPAALDRAATYIEDTFEELGCKVERHSFEVWDGSVSNLECAFPGAATPEEIVVVGAHYDSAGGSPGANDNASGVAALLEVARRLSQPPRARTVRFVAFVNEEPPFFQTPRMGSFVYAESVAREPGRVVAMLSLETLGFYSDAPDSQSYPPLLGLLYPERGDFVAFVANPASRSLVQRAIRTFRASGAAVASEGIAAPAFIEGVAWSDHWAFWQHDIPAIMVTDTAFLRYREYHTPGDTPDRLDYPRMASVVQGLVAVVRELAPAS
jgi:hypothetical protein